MKTYTIKTKKNGQQWNETGEIYAENWLEAKRKFTNNARNFAAGDCGYMYAETEADLSEQANQFADFQGAGFLKPNKMKNYSTIKVSGRTHVVCNVSPRGSYPDPNYMNTGKALCGVIEKGKTLDDWKLKHHKK